ncbi:unnamed protein product [Darwinula stevensoni]|uniref:Peptidase S1 domain-containing protein n=1 Tax=Darwinula stevensoni TaxID=69355 RepID=A0A7R9FS46_9CRUS|nr:unnamed protein product [Darwinula stevensoni]CAG0902791.1 unnamed protein product [Darwinula stevensoni]
MNVTTEECGVTGAAREGTTDMEARQSSPARRNWLYRLWNGFLSGVVGGQLPEPDPLIINGSPATITEAPFMAHLFMEYSTWGKAMTENCSGSIISHRWILTAAHCLHQGQKSALVDRVTVRVGSADRGTGTAIAADAFRVHPDFNPKNLNSGNDIALVHLNADLTFGPSIQPLCYPTSDDVGAATAPCDQKVYGWGILSDKNKVTPRNLQKLDVSVSAKAASDCSGVDGKIVCVTGKTPGSGPCRGFSVFRRSGQCFRTVFHGNAASKADGNRLNFPKRHEG